MPAAIIAKHLVVPIFLAENSDGGTRVWVGCTAGARRQHNTERLSTIKIGFSEFLVIHGNPRGEWGKKIWYLDWQLVVHKIRHTLGQRTRMFENRIKD
jgi:hypothetical protein